MKKISIPLKLTGETYNQAFDFTSRLALGETISTAVTTSVVYTGTDPIPSGVINGAASISGSVVTQSLTAGVAGVVYEITCTVTTSLSQTLQIGGYLAVEGAI